MNAKSVARWSQPRGLTLAITDHNYSLPITTAASCSKSGKTEEVTKNAPVCVCCLVRDGTFVKLASCRHLLLFCSIPKFQIQNSNKVVCKDCHNILIKFWQFMQQVKENSDALSFAHALHSDMTVNRKILDLKRAPTEFVSFVKQNNINNDLMGKKQFYYNSTTEFVNIDSIKEDIDDGETTDDAEFDMESLTRDPTVKDYTIEDLEANIPFSVHKIHSSVKVIPFSEVNIDPIKEEIDDGETTDNAEFNIMESLTRDPTVKDSTIEDLEANIPVNKIHSSVKVIPLSEVKKKWLGADKPKVIMTKSSEQDHKNYLKHFRMKKVAIANSSNGVIVSNDFDTKFDKLDAELLVGDKKLNEGRKEKSFQEKLDEERKKHLKEMESKRYANLEAKEYEGKIRLMHLTLEETMAEMRARRLTPPYRHMAHKCSQCIVGFDYKDDLRRHKKRLHYKSFHVCAICKRSASSEQSLKTHYSRHFTRFECEACSAKFAGLKSAVNHYNNNHELLVEPPKFKCDTCDFVTDCSIKLKHHTHKKRKRNKTYKCQQCSKICYSNSMLREHILLVHEKRKPQKLYKCDKCGKSYDRYKKLELHNKIVHDEADYYCVECDTHYSCQYSYKIHIQRSKKHFIPDQMSICDYCGKIFGRKNLIRRHIMSHMKLFFFKCHICGKGFRTPKQMKDHISLVHEKQSRPRPHVCDLCGKTFTDKSILKSHLRTHTGERPYKCRNCTATFGHSAALYTHNKLVHKLRGATATPPKENQSDSEKSAANDIM